jgi:hypothetical protein
MITRYVLFGHECAVGDGVETFEDIIKEHFQQITPDILKEPITFEVQPMNAIPYAGDEAEELKVLDEVLSQCYSHESSNVKPASGFEPSIPWPDPTPEQLNTLWFNRIWDAIKTWDINVPEAYEGYCGATGNHVVHILNAITADHKKYFDEHEQWK